MLPLMMSIQADALMKEFDNIIDKPAEESLFRMNLNPIRVGLSLFKTFDDIQKRFGYSMFVTNEM